MRALPFDSKKTAQAEFANREKPKTKNLKRKGNKRRLPARKA
jgi:hypothetical protein